MQQELSLIHAQLNLIQQTLNVVLDKLSMLERRNQADTKSEILKIGKSTSYIKDLNCSSHLNPLTSMSSSLKITDNAAPTSSSRHSPQHLNTYFEQFIAQALERANSIEASPTTQESPTAHQNGVVAEVRVGNVVPVTLTDDKVLPKKHKSPFRECIDCGELKKISGQNRCHTCYMRVYHQQKRKKLQPQQCAGCGEMKELRAKERCRSCYHHYQDSKQNYQICIDCKELRKLTGNKRCHPCYMRVYHQQRRKPKYTKVGTKRRKLVETTFEDELVPETSSSMERSEPEAIAMQFVKMEELVVGENTNGEQ